MPTISFCSRKRLTYPPSTSMAVLYVFFLLIVIQTCITSQSKAVAIRIFPQRGGPIVENSPPKINQTEMFKEYFQSRLASDLLFNGTNVSADGNVTVLDDKRRIPSCPDPLHN